MSLFAFLQREWPDVFEATAKAEAGAYPDPRAACFYARRALEYFNQNLPVADGRVADSLGAETLQDAA